MSSNFENIKTLAELFNMLNESKGEDEEMVNIAFNSSRENRTRMTKGTRARQDSLYCGMGYDDNLIVCLGSYYAEHPEVQKQFNPEGSNLTYPVTIEFNADMLEIQVYNNEKKYEASFKYLEKMLKEYNVTALVEQIAESFGYTLHICSAERCEEEQEGVKGMEDLFGKSATNYDENDIDDEDTDNYDECGGCCGCCSSDSDEDDCCCSCCSSDSDEDDCCEDDIDFDDYTLGELKELAVYGEQYLAEQEAGIEDVEACDITEYDRALKIIKEASEKIFNIELADREAELIYTVLFNSKQISDNLYK